MTDIERNQIICEIRALLNKLEYDSGTTSISMYVPSNPPSIEMLTLSECTELIRGVSESTIRKLVRKGVLPSVRAGNGKNGKILVNKQELLKYYTR